MFVLLDYRSRQPLYEQLIEGIRTMVLQGVLPPGSKLPAVRQLAAELAINPNTIQKAYAELERQGVICSCAGRGSFISESLSDLVSSHARELLGAVKEAVAAAAAAGLDEAAIRSACDAGLTKASEKEENHHD